MRAIGVDVGTGFIACAEKEEDKRVYRKIRDAFFKVDTSKFLTGSAAGFGEEMLKKSGANYLKVEGEIFILGDDAFKFANTFHQECMRPMSQGILNPRQQISGMMVGELIRALTGEPKGSDDVLYYCVPAEPLDADFDVEYHQELLRGIFSDLGYGTVEVMTEGLAVVYSELVADQYTGIGISFGAGMCNVAYVNLGMPVLAFSVARGGDWIDSHAAKHTEETANVVSSVKEEMESLDQRDNQIQHAVSIYYDALMRYVVEQFNLLYERTSNKDLPNLSDIPLVVSGGTSLIGGFSDRFQAIMKEGGFPVKVSRVERAKEPLFAVANGLFEAAEISALKGEPDE